MQFCQLRPAERKRFQPSADIGLDGKPPYGISPAIARMDDVVAAGYKQGIEYIDKAIAQAPAPMTLYGLRQSGRDYDYGRRAAAAKTGRRGGRRPVPVG